MSVGINDAPKKKVSEIEIPGQGDLCEEHPSMWAILCDEGYTGLTTMYYIVVRPLYHLYGSTIQSFRIKSLVMSGLWLISWHVTKKIFWQSLIEKYFEKLCSFTLFGSRWRLDVCRYSTFLRFRVAITNVRIVWNPLRRSDRALFNYIKNRLASTCEIQTKKCTSSQHEYKEQCRPRLSVMMSNGNAVKQKSNDNGPIDSLN